jgi:L-threonylcarbamoyladenylate synthase
VQLLAGSVEAVAKSDLIFTTRARKAAEKFWPGALTLVIDRPDGGTEGVRVPDDETACALCLASGGMLRCTSANTSGQPPALDAAMAVAAIPDADMLVDGGRVKGGTASTVVQITDTTVRFFRIGDVSEDQIIACLSDETSI